MTLHPYLKHTSRECRRNRKTWTIANRLHSIERAKCGPPYKSHFILLYWNTIPKFNSEWSSFNSFLQRWTNQFSLWHIHIIKYSVYRHCLALNVKTHAPPYLIPTKQNCKYHTAESSHELHALHRKWYHQDHQPPSSCARFRRSKTSGSHIPGNDTQSALIMISVIFIFINTNVHMSVYITAWLNDCCNLD